MSKATKVISALLLSPLVLLVTAVAVAVLGPLSVAGYLLACALGAILLLRRPVTNLGYAAIPAAVMGITTAFLPPYACGYEPSFYDTYVLAAIFILAALHVFRAETLEGCVCGLLSLYCGVAVALHLQTGLCHADYPGEFDLLERWFRGGVWLAASSAMAIGWLCAWGGTRILRHAPSARERI